MRQHWIAETTGDPRAGLCSEDRLLVDVRAVAVGAGCWWAVGAGDCAGGATGMVVVGDPAVAVAVVAPAGLGGRGFGVGGAGAELHVCVGVDALQEGLEQAVGGAS